MEEKNELSVEIFKYEMLDMNTSEFLQQCEAEIEETLGQAATRVGEVLKKAQEKLSGNRYNGVFGKWLDHVGYARRTAYELINRYETVMRIPHDSERELFESLPISLSKQISAKSSESTLAKSQAKEEVLSGSIDTLKEYQLRIKELELANIQKEEENSKIITQLQKELNKPHQIETKVVEKEVIIDNTDYTKIKNLNQQLDSNIVKLRKVEDQKEKLEEYIKMNEDDANEYRKIKEEIDRLHSQKDDLHRQIESATSLSALYVDIEEFISTKLSPIKYSRALTERRDSKVAMDNLREIISIVEEWSKEMKTYLPNENNNIIDAEVIEYV